jgi:HEAT repeat protein
MKGNEMVRIILLCAMLTFIFINPMLAITNESRQTNTATEKWDKLEPQFATTDIDSLINLLSNEKASVRKRSSDLLFLAAANRKNQMSFDDNKIKRLTLEVKNNKYKETTGGIVKILWQVVERKVENKFKESVKEIGGYSFNLDLVTSRILKDFLSEKTNFKDETIKNKALKALEFNDFKKENRRIIEALVEVINTPNAPGQVYAIYALTEIGGDKRIEDNLINIIKDKPTLEMQAIQLAAAIYLGSTKSEKAIVPIKESLIDLVKSPNIEIKEPQFGLEAPEIPYNSYKIVYANALITLGKHYNINIGDFISDGNKEIKYLGAYVLGKLGDKNQVPVLCESLLKNENPYERKLAAEVLGELGDKSAIKSLREAYKNDGFGLPGISGGYPVREAARRSLINLGISIK